MVGHLSCQNEAPQCVRFDTVLFYSTGKVQLLALCPLNVTRQARCPANKVNEACIFQVHIEAHLLHYGYRPIYLGLLIDWARGRSAMSRLQCLMCDHYQFSQKCLAYPERIPAEIYFGQIDHTEVYPGDHGTTFKELVVIDATPRSVPRPSKIKLSSITYDDGSKCLTVFNTKTRQLITTLELPLPERFRKRHRGRPRKSKEQE